MTTTESEFPWINKEYIQLILSKFEVQGRSQLNDYKIASGAIQGENFAGVIFRVSVDYTLNETTKHVNLILKASPVGGAVAEFLETFSVFEGESLTYQNILGDLDKLLPGFKMAPRLIYADDKAMVLEDLTSLDFQLANRKNRFDFEQSKLVLAKLATFHALTAFIYKHSPNKMERYKFSAHDSEEMTPLSFFFSASLQESLETIRNCDDLQKYVQFLEAYDIVQEEKLVFSRSKEDRFHVLNHGDLWINNIFFKNNENKEPSDVLFVDYQESYFGSPGIDINHFFYTSCNYDVHANHLDELIVHYHNNLVSTLEILKYSEIPTLDDIKYEVKSKAQQGLIALLSVVPVQMIDNPEHANPEYFLADTEEAQAIRREVYGNREFVEILKMLLPKLKAREVLGKTKSHN